MEKNYYEILEVDKNASPEVIKKAYNTLAKKNHPDLQPENMKKYAEEKLKLINQAYETLFNEESRAQYDIQLTKKNIQNQQINKELINENKALKEKIQHLKESQYFTNQTRSNISENYTDNDYTIDDTTNEQNYKNYYSNIQKNIEYQQELQQAREKAYYDAYIQDLKNRGYKIKYKKTWQDYLKSLIALIGTIIILFCIYQIPAVKNFFVAMYNENDIFKLFVDFISNFFK